MSQDERKQIRDTKLVKYIDAIDNREAHCGNLSEIIDVFRQVVTLYDKNALDGSLSGLQLPSHEALVEAVVECQEAKQLEKARYEDALNAGVDASRIPVPGGKRKAPMPFA